ncbi:hypothetical protein NEOLEDRAFT_207535 [Neolentinus lepideus HHB14362 ss-1]|uniref:N-acetyltransferase domain-containing protein n=1 Tax=Neolentinus lepideus HHB14362 ss-1 TaxID=1314782 RepID=A0A165TJN3_9AGAM|nr:hypothetical protein NEOLEDRAFT_207535 [Neolentinus lepideus HHB14362 ss-1]
MESTLFKVDLTQPESALKLVHLLQPCIPQCLPVLGTLLHSSPSHGESPTSYGSISNLYAWASFDLDATGTPSLFSVVVISTLDNNQARYFCSAENNQEEPSQQEKAHVLDFIRAFLNIVNKLGLSSSIKMIPANEQVTAKGGIMVGSMHQKWVDTLSPLAGRIGPCTKFLRPPSVPGSAPITIGGLEGNFTISPLTALDIQTLVSTSAIPHSKEYFLSRCDTSICIGTIGAEGSPSQPVAWALQHTDGSIGTLYVQPELRGKGLARTVVESLVRRLDQAEMPEERGGAFRWNWVDTVENNVNAERFFGSLQGWNKGWMCYWMFLAFPSA